MRVQSGPEGTGAAPGAAAGSMADQLIPRIIHRIWLGSNPVPSIFEYYEHSWRQHHPGWELRLWRDDTLPVLSCQRQWEHQGLKRRIDIAKLEILRQCGGIFIDMDVEAIRPLDPLLRGVTAFLGRYARHHVGQAVLGAVPYHPFFERAIERLASTIGVAGTTSKVAGKAFLEGVLRDHPDGVTLFPPETFYFEPSFEPPRRPHDFPTVYTVHHELASYVAALPPDTLQLRLEKLIAHATDGSGLDDEALGRLQRAAQRLRKGIVQHDVSSRANIRRVEAERERAEALLRVARARIEDLERQLAATTEHLGQRKRRSVLAPLRQLITKVGARSSSHPGGSRDSQSRNRDRESDTESLRAVRQDELL